jgi:hypothetical protein
MSNSGIGYGSTTPAFEKWVAQKSEGHGSMGIIDRTLEELAAFWIKAAFEEIEHRSGILLKRYEGAHEETLLWAMADLRDEWGLR